MSRFVLLLLTLSLIGCSALPTKSNTPIAAYNKLIVRDINWKETAVSEIEGDDLAEYIAAQPRLSEIFRQEFANHIGEIHFFNQVSYGNGAGDEETLILEPKIYTLKPEGHAPGASYTGLLWTKDGKLIGKYTSERRRHPAASWSPISNIEVLVGELGEDAASRLPYAR